jgi:hypothetical protein
MSEAESELAVRAEIGKYLDPKGKGKKLANRLALILLKEPDQDMAYSALVAASAMLISDPNPEITKENAVQMAKDFGDHVAHEVDLAFDIFVTNRKRIFPQRSN